MKDPHAHIVFKALSKNRKIKKILAIRLQATGDVIISLPYLQSLRDQLPAEVQLDLLVREECKDIPEQLTIFNKVHVLKGGRNSKLQLLHFLFLIPRLWLRHYDVLLDLQNHRLSKIMRRMLRVKAWTVFDRTSSNYAGDRYKNTINSLDLPRVAFKQLTSFKEEGDAAFKKSGLQAGVNYIVINPAGAFANRNWDLENYLEFCRLWLQTVDSKAVFLMIGLPRLEPQAAFLARQLSSSFISLVGKTTQMEAMQLLRKAQLLVSEDSGLLHMAYCVGTPCVGILGSTRNDWTNPNLPHTRFFHSSDLPCGNCMLEACLYEEVRCLTRITPTMVLHSAKEIIC